MCGEDTESKIPFAKNTTKPVTLVRVLKSKQLLQAIAKNIVPKMAYFCTAIEFAF
jgi:hypothetical protein